MAVFGFGIAITRMIGQLQDALLSGRALDVFIGSKIIRVRCSNLVQTLNKFERFEHLK
jgi:hypothetical protein